jgi:hypothetical protein
MQYRYIITRLFTTVKEKKYSSSYSYSYSYVICFVQSSPDLERSSQSLKRRKLEGGRTATSSLAHPASAGRSKAFQKTAVVESKKAVTAEEDDSLTSSDDESGAEDGVKVCIRDGGEVLLRILIHFIRIRIQHFRLNTDPDPGH